MRDLETAFGKNLTTRSRGTVLKVASRFDSEPGARIVRTPG